MCKIYRTSPGGQEDDDAEIDQEDSFAIITSFFEEKGQAGYNFVCLCESILAEKKLGGVTR